MVRSHHGGATPPSVMVLFLQTNPKIFDKFGKQYIWNKVLVDLHYSKKGLDVFES